MRCGLFGIAVTALMGATLGGCAQMTRHSNTLVFGTNTSFGVKVGADATATPGITVGYSRQEAVVMPLVANTANVGEVQAPCPQVVAPGTTVATLPQVCVLKGKDGTGASDAYSVLASFGTKYSAEAPNPKVGGEISQYFATGLAARTLAQRAGAAAVASGEAAVANADGVALATSRENALDALAKKMAAQNDDAAVATAVKSIDTAIGGDLFKIACSVAPATTPGGCASAMRADGLIKLQSPSQLAKALTAF